MTAFRVAALPAADLDRVRGRAEDDFGNAVEPFAAGGGEPLRCCLRDADPGERITLVAWRPAPVAGPYAEVGPVFVHAGTCDGYADEDRYPEGFRRRQQLLRAYDAAGRQVENVIVDGVAAERGIAGLLARPDVAYLHSRNVLAGCYMFTVHRA